MAEILIGQTVAFAADPFVEGPGAMRRAFACVFKENCAYGR